MDPSVAPGDDFNAYANGAWIRDTPIPEDKPRYSVYSKVDELTRERIQKLIEAAANGAAPGGDLRKIGDYYASFLDESGVEAKGIAPVKPRLDAIRAIAGKRDLARVLGASLRSDVDPLNATNFETENVLGVWITQGLGDPARSYPYLLQGGLGMPDREYYLSAAPKMAEVRTNYLQHAAAMLHLAGLNDFEARAAGVIQLETKIAKAHATREESADVNNAALWQRADLDKKAPGLDWASLLEAARLNRAPAFYLWHPRAIAGIAALAGSEPLETWKDWLTLHALEQAAPFLSKAFVEERFRFRGKVLAGTPAISPRWKRAVDFTSADLGDAVGRAYVEHHFPAESKVQAQAMVEQLRKAFGKRIDGAAWMSAETRARARRKLETLIVGVGYPDEWVDYSGLEIVKGDPLGNHQRCLLFDYERQLAKLGQPVDRGEWWLTPQTIDALNMPLQNALNFPAAFLQPPSFEPQAGAAHNFGALGAVIGHEISHSFDDQGAQFDAEGRLVNWWTKADYEQFQAAGAALARQYDAYRPFPDLALNGKQTLSENIADVAGLMTAYDAYRQSLEGKADAVVDGFTGDQRFFLSYAQTWRSKSREAALRRQVATDGHAPAAYRVATVRNLDPWYEAFHVAPGQKLYLPPAARVHVW